MTLILSGTDGLSDVDGTAATPAIRGTDTNTGIFFPAADTIAFAEGGAESARFDASGNLLVGQTSGSSKLSVTDANDRNFSTAQFKITGSGYTTALFMDGTAASLGQDSNSREFRMWSGSNASVGVKLTAGATSWAALSDENEKEILNPITNAVGKLSELRTVIGKYKADAEDARRSFLIAQDVKAVFPEAVSQDAEGILSLRYTDMIPVLVKAIQELKAELDSVKAELATLKEQP
jgi:hypothetical protein